MAIPVVPAIIVAGASFIAYNARKAAPEIAESIRSLERPIILTAGAFALYTYLTKK